MLNHCAEQYGIDVSKAINPKTRLQLLTENLAKINTVVLGLDTSCEVATSKGRIDLVLFTERYLYVIELKFNESAKRALEQIFDRKYYEKYLNSGKEVVLVGMSLNNKQKELHIDWIKGKS